MKTMATATACYPSTTPEERSLQVLSENQLSPRSVYQWVHNGLEQCKSRFDFMVGDSLSGFSRIHCTDIIPASLASRNTKLRVNGKTEAKADVPRKHHTKLRNTKELPGDLVTSDIFVDVDISEEYKKDMCQLHLATEVKNVVQFSLQQSFTAKSKSESRFTLKAVVFSVSDGTVFGTFLSGTAHLLGETVVGLEWRLFDSRSPNQTFESPSYRGGLLVLTQHLETDFFDLLNKGKKNVTQQLSPAAAEDIASSVDLRCAEL